MDRNPINQLPQSLVNRIAAGEVIERPASVVKELVDNAIDAGATRIEVDIEDGGRAMIRVTDDGHGIPPEELPLAFAAHATSKLTSDDDLFRIRTMGFRGEALASVGSVSQSRILSRTLASDAAYELTNNGGELGGAVALAGNVGTTVEVRNLFFNVPARRKFVKGTQTEFGHIADMVVRLALPQPQIAFRLTHNGRVVRELPVALTPRERWLAAWPEELRQEHLPIQSRDRDENGSDVRVRGLIGMPASAALTAKHQHLYVNGRPIRDRFIQHALREAYRGLTEPGRHPPAILLIEVPPDTVDVNVHPTKSEVRFADSSRIYGLIHSTIRQTLLGNDLTPTAIATPGDISGRPAADPGRESMQQKLADFFRTAPSNAITSAVAPAFTALTQATRPTASVFDVAFSSSRFNNSSSDALNRPTDSNPSRLSDPAIPASLASTPESLAPSRQVSTHSASAPVIKAIQLHNSYLVVESDEGMLVIDQHALHERILYEDLLAKFTAGPLESQRMLIPQTLRASPRQLDLLEQLAPMLTKLGVEASPMGPETIGVTAFPSFLDRLDPVAFMQDLLERGEQELLDLTHEELLHEVLDMMSCKAAIKAGDTLTPPEIDALLARRHLIERSSNCPHGRPTTLRLSLRDLEKQFKRTGF